MTTPAQVCVVGSINLDLVARVDRLAGPGETLLATGYEEIPGGKGSNQAIGVARAGAEVAMIGAVGDDEAASTMLAALDGEGVDTSGVLRRTGATGRALIGVDDRGENSIIVVPGANASLGPADLDAVGDRIARARAVLVQLEIPLDTVQRALEWAREDAWTVLNPAPARPVPGSILSRCRVVIPNEHEVAGLGGVSALLDAGVEWVIVTEGARGARLVGQDRDEVRIAPFPVDPVDTTAAGDAFCAMVTARLAAGDPIHRAARAGAAAGALATLTPGAGPSLPTWAAVQSLLST